MTRRCFVSLGVAVTAVGAETPTETITGTLVSGSAPRLKLDGGAAVSLSGDKSTMLILGDGRLNGSELELAGRFVEKGRFQVGPIHTRSLYVIRDGKRLFVTYWCDLCAIRTYAPGKCMCCQAETALDLRESLE